MLSAVIFDVIGRNDGPWIYVGGQISSLDRNNYIPQKTKNILRLSRQEPDREACLRSAAIQTSDLLRFVMGSVSSQSEVYRTEVLKVRGRPRKATVGNASPWS